MFIRPEYVEGSHVRLSHALSARLMISHPQDTIELLLQHLRNGEPKAVELLLERTYARLQRLTRAMLRDFPTVRRWEETDDVWQTAVVRLRQAIVEAEPESPRHY